MSERQIVTLATLKFLTGTWNLAWGILGTFAYINPLTAVTVITCTIVASVLLTVAIAIR